MKITLDVDNTDQVPDELYDFLLDQFIARALELGVDVVNDPKIMLSNWTITCEAVDID